MTIEEAVLALRKFCPVHEKIAGGATQRLGVEEGWIIFACGCRQSQRTGAVETPNLLDQVVTATEGSASSAPLPSPEIKLPQTS